VTDGGPAFQPCGANREIQKIEDPVFGATLGQPQHFLQARMMRLALLIDF
jgi:hypothetical protein